jgi:hypothetical protein
MSKKNTIILLERLLNQSRKDKLMYLNAADRQDLPAFKRFFNKQALYRNSMFYDFSNLLTEHGIEVEDVILKSPDIRQLMMTTPGRDKKNSFAECLSQDQLFKINLEELIQVDLTEKNVLIYQKHLIKIDASINENDLFSTEVSAKAFLTSGYL